MFVFILCSVCVLSVVLSCSVELSPFYPVYSITSVANLCSCKNRQLLEHISNLDDINCQKNANWQHDLECTVAIMVLENIACDMHARVLEWSTL